MPANPSSTISTSNPSALRDPLKIPLGKATAAHLSRVSIGEPSQWNRDGLSGPAVHHCGKIQTPCRWYLVGLTSACQNCLPRPVQKMDDPRRLNEISTEASHLLKASALISELNVAKLTVGGAYPSSGQGERLGGSACTRTCRRAQML